MRCQFVVTPSALLLGKLMCRCGRNWSKAYRKRAPSIKPVAAGSAFWKPLPPVISIAGARSDREARGYHHAAGEAEHPVENRALELLKKKYESSPKRRQKPCKERREQRSHNGIKTLKKCDHRLHICPQACSSDYLARAVATLFCNDFVLLRRATLGQTITTSARHSHRYLRRLTKSPRSTP